MSLDVAAMDNKKKKKSLLEEITRLKSKSFDFQMKIGESFSSKGKPIIVVPASFIQGNICLKNAHKFLQEGQYTAGSDGGNSQNAMNG